MIFLRTAVFLAIFTSFTSCEGNTPLTDDAPSMFSLQAYLDMEKSFYHSVASGEIAVISGQEEIDGEPNNLELTVVMVEFKDDVDYITFTLLPDSQYHDYKATFIPNQNIFGNETPINDVNGVITIDYPASGLARGDFVGKLELRDTYTDTDPDQTDSGESYDVARVMNQ